ncbi:MAG: VTT domain-containing protein [Candidatus Heimdallarchaeota archaeon]
MSDKEDILELDDSKEKSSENEDILLFDSEEKGIRTLIKKIWFWLKESKQRTLSLAFLLLFIAFMIFLGIFEKDPTSLMLELVYWFKDRTGDVGLYLGVGVISIFGNFVMFIPVLYAVVLMFVAVMPGINVFLLGLAAGIGASIGQIASWFVGRATREVAGDKLEKQLRKTQRWVERGLAPIMIFIFAATPLPDEVLLIMIGLIGYSLGKTLIYCFIGKIVLTLSISVVANLFSTTAIGEWFLETLFGLTRTMLINQELPAGNNIWTSIAIWIISATMVVAVTFVDWVGMYDKYLSKREQRQLTQIFEVANTSFELDESSITLEQANSPISIQLLEEHEQQSFPEESLWLFQEKLSKKKNAFFRKSLIAIDTIANTSIDISINKEWLEKFRMNILDLKFKSVKNRTMELVKFPQKVLDVGFIVSESRLIEFQIKLKNILPEENLSVLLDKYDFKKREKRQLLRTNVNVEVLIETLSNGETRVWAMGLKEGTYINKIYKFRKVESIFFWLQLLNCLSKHPSEVKGLLIFNLIDTTCEDVEIVVPEDSLDGCPI